MKITLTGEESLRLEPMSGPLTIEAQSHDQSYSPFHMLGSALGCYLIFNLNVLNHWDKLAKLLSGRATAAGPYAGNTTADANAERVRNSFAAVDAFLRDLSGLGLPSDRVLFTMDGFRDPDRAGNSPSATAALCGDRASPKGGDRRLHPASG